MKKSCVSTARGAEPQISAFKFGPTLLPNRGEQQRACKREPERVAEAAVLTKAPEMRLLRARENGSREAAAFANRFLNLASDAFEQSRHIQEIIGRGNFQFVGKFREVGRERKHARCGKARSAARSTNRRSKMGDSEKYRPVCCAGPSARRAARSCSRACGSRCLTFSTTPLGSPEVPDV